MKKAELSPELQREVERLALLPEATIDLTDIPELPAEAWLQARRSGATRHGQTTVKDENARRERAA